MRATFAIAAALMLAACGTTQEPEARIRTVEIHIPVTASCVPSKLGQPPAYPDTDQALKAAPGAAERYQLMAAGRLVRTQRLSELEPVIAGCRPKPPSGPP